MTTEQLLIQRYKVIAPYPGCGYQVGDIILEVDANLSKFVKQGDDRNFQYIQYPANYPANFQPLPWYAERKKSEMPEFIKCDERVWKVKEWCIDLFGKFFPMNEVDAEEETENFANIKWHFSKEKFLPCTSADYEQWKQSINK